MRRCCVSKARPSAVPAALADEPQLREALRAVKRSALRKRGLAAGVEEALLEEAGDGPDPLEAIIDLIVAAELPRRASGMPPKIGNDASAAMRLQLAELKVSELRRAAREAGVDESLVEEAEDGAAPKEQLVELIVDASCGAAQNALRAELGGLKANELRKRALREGAGDEAAQAAEDSDDPQAEFVELVCALAAGAPPAARVSGAIASGLPADLDAVSREPDAASVLHDELSQLKLAALHKRAVAEGLDEMRIDGAMDSDSPKAEIIALLAEIATSGPSADGAHKQKLLEELQGLKLMELHRRATIENTAEDQLEDAMNSDDPKASLIALLMTMPPVVVPATDDRPHFGTKQATQRDKPAPRKGPLPANKHAMISYQWDDQERVAAARETLTRLGIPCWMDIDGGMQQDIYESMAEGVENAACVVCFLSQKYQDSVSAQACPHQNLTSRDASERLALIAGELQT